MKERTQTHQDFKRFLKDKDITDTQLYDLCVTQYGTSEDLVVSAVALGNYVILTDDLLDKIQELKNQLEKAKTKTYDIWKRKLTFWVKPILTPSNMTTQ